MTASAIPDNSVERSPMPHGLMFHHFHGPDFAPSQGSIDADTLAAIIEHYRRQHCLLDAGEFRRRAYAGELGAGDVCLTFDDSLRCQYEIARPVLERFEVRAFWFVYSSVIDGNIEPLEVFRRFRTEHFASVEEFYAAFFRAIDRSAYAAAVADTLDGFSPSTYLAEFAFYTDGDRKFRYLRDVSLGPDAYAEIMRQMMAVAGTTPAALSEGLWMDADQLRRLDGDGHVIGLHTHTHPTALAGMSAEQQRGEYARNREVLTRVLGTTPDTMSHPCNSYSDTTLTVLDSLGIGLGFRSNMTAGFTSALEYPREDHANIVTRLGL